jgi:hypothetical protein
LREDALVDLDDYRQPGAFTTLAAGQERLVQDLDATPPSLCGVAQGLLILPDLAVAAGVSEARLEERNVRSAAEIVWLALELDDAPLEHPRSAEARVVGTCRHFAVLSCALLRATGIAARARCGFATYFQPGLNVDHWITEYLDEASQRWVRVDSEILGFGLVERPDDLAVGEFLTGGEAWRDYRDGRRHPVSFGVHGTDNWGPAEIIGNVIRDLGALHSVETLPWDEWGPMRQCYDGDIDTETELLIDAVADACVRESPDLVALYCQLEVPGDLLR